MTKVTKVRLATFLVLGISILALVAFSTSDLARPSEWDWFAISLCLWLFSPYALAIPVCLVRRRNLASSVAVLVGTVLSCGFGLFALGWIWLEAMDGNAEAGMALPLIPFIQWPGFLVTAAVASIFSYM